MLRLGALFVAYLSFTVLGGIASAQMSAPPPTGYDVHSYNATIRLDRILNTISGEVEMTAMSLGDLPKILQHAKFLSIDSVFVDGARSQIKVTDSISGSYIITGYPANYHNGSDFSVRTFYHGKGTNEGGNNPWGGVQNKGNMMFAMGVGFTAPYISCTRHWLPCYDEPEDKADSVTLRFLADTSGIVVSNGIQTSYGVLGDKKTTFSEWKISHPISTYLLTFAFGPFQHLSIPNSLHIPFDAYGMTKDTTRLRAVMEKLVVNALSYFDSLFWKYPFEKVGYVVAPIGSMEHQTMITLIGQALDTTNTTAVHELSHQWWGDYVTCGDFNDAWLNEGFATYCEALFTERFFGKTQYWSRHHSNIIGAMTTLNSGIPLFGAPFSTSPRNNYPPVIYQKGAAVLGMLRYFIGDTAFFNGIRAYAERSAYSSATSYDLAEMCSMAAHKNLWWFFKKWVFGSGHPILNIAWTKNVNSIKLNIAQIQDTVKIGYFRLPLVVEARTKDGKFERHEILVDSVRLNEVTFENSFVPDTIVIDPDGAVIKKINGSVKLGVATQANSDEKPDLFSLRFTPNPSKSRTITVAIKPDRKSVV